MRPAPAPPRTRATGRPQSGRVSRRQGSGGAAAAAQSAGAGPRAAARAPAAAAALCGAGARPQPRRRRLRQRSGRTDERGRSRVGPVVPTCATAWGQPEACLARPGSTLLCYPLPELAAQAAPCQPALGRSQGCQERMNKSGRGRSTTERQFNKGMGSCFTLSCRSDPTRQTSQHQYSHAQYAVARRQARACPLSARTYTFIPVPMAGMGMQGPRAPLPTLGTTKLVTDGTTHTTSMGSRMTHMPTSALPWTCKRTDMSGGLQTVRPAPKWPVQWHRQLPTNKKHRASAIAVVIQKAAPSSNDFVGVHPVTEQDHSWLDNMTMRSAHDALRIRLLVLRSLREQPHCSTN